jgi:hypothetical protein
MGCCSPNYRKVVNEKEAEINEQGSEKLPLFLKLTSIVIILIGLLTIY